MIKALWLCNIVLPEFSQEFGIKKNNFGGWITGMLHGLEKTGEVDISLCFPIRDVNRMRNGNCNGHAYYSFLCDFSMVECKEEMVKTFEDILNTSKPDIIHIWGTEYVHTLAMLKACDRQGMLNRAVINIQGLVSVCARHYMLGIPEYYRKLQSTNGVSIYSDKANFERRGINEIDSLRMVRHVVGRTDWDRACAEAINPNVRYHFCNEILRETFYKYIGIWSYEKCKKYSIFVSQATYPIKGFHYLLKALPIIINRYNDTHVYVAGADILNLEVLNPYAVYIKELIDKYKLSCYITFIGTLNDEQMVQQYLSANVFVSASTIENESNSLSEARLIGTPVVSSFVGGAYERITCGEDGFLYPCEDTELLAYYICQIFENREDICKKFSEKSNLLIKDVCEREKNTDVTLNVYHEICDGTSGVLSR